LLEDFHGSTQVALPLLNMQGFDFGQLAGSH
jgi:hypothetical protein